MSIFQLVKMRIVLLLSFVLLSLFYVSQAALPICGELGVVTLALDEAFDEENTLGNGNVAVHKLTHCNGELCEVKCQKLCVGRKPVETSIKFDLEKQLQSNPLQSEIFDSICKMSLGNIVGESGKKASAFLRDILLNYQGSKISAKKTKPLLENESDVVFATKLSGLFKDQYSQMRKHIFLALAYLQKGFHSFIRFQSTKKVLGNVQQELEQFMESHPNFLQAAVLNHAIRSDKCGGLLTKETCDKIGKEVIQYYVDKRTKIIDYNKELIAKGTKNYCSLDTILKFDKILSENKKTADKLTLTEIGSEYAENVDFGKRNEKIFNDLLKSVDKDAKVPKGKKSKKGHSEKKSRKGKSNKKSTDNSSELIKKNFKELSKLVHKHMNGLKSKLEKGFNKIENSMEENTLEAFTEGRRFIPRSSPSRSSPSRSSPSRSPSRSSPNRSSPSRSSPSKHSPSGKPSNRNSGPSKRRNEKSQGKNRDSKKFGHNNRRDSNRRESRGGRLTVGSPRFGRNILRDLMSAGSASRKVLSHIHRSTDEEVKDLKKKFKKNQVANLKNLHQLALKVFTIVDSTEENIKHQTIEYFKQRLAQNNQQALWKSQIEGILVLARKECGCQ
jgi:hypothetical protein